MDLFKNIVPDYINNFNLYFKGNLLNNGSFESQLSSICDDIAYNNNDIDDGLHAGFFSIDELLELDIVKSTLSKIKRKKSKDPERTKYELVRNLIKLMVDDLINNTKNNLKNYKINSPIDIEQQKIKIVCLSNEMMEQEKKIKKIF